MYLSDQPKFHNCSTNLNEAISGLSTNPSDKKPIFIIGGIIAAIAVLLFAYLMWFTAPEENIERVKVVAVTESGRF